jgi:hypothetical protein
VVVEVTAAEVVVESAAATTTGEGSANAVPSIIMTESAEMGTQAGDIGRSGFNKAAFSSTTAAFSDSNVAMAASAEDAAATNGADGKAPSA